MLTQYRRIAAGIIPIVVVLLSQLGITDVTNEVTQIVESGALLLAGALALWSKYASVQAAKGGK